MTEWKCTLDELDFEKGTATFLIPEGSNWLAGDYIIKHVAAAPSPTEDIDLRKIADMLINWGEECAWRRFKGMEYGEFRQRHVDKAVEYLQITKGN